MLGPFKMNGHALPGIKQKTTPSKKVAPVKYAQLIAMAAPMIMDAVKKKKEK